MRKLSSDVFCQIGWVHNTKPGAGRRLVIRDLERAATRQRRLDRVGKQALRLQRNIN